MPAMANLVVKKYDGVTDITFDALNGAGGEAPAEWRQDTGAAAGLPTGLRSTMKASSKWNGPKTSRQVELAFKFPYATQDSTTTKYSATDACVGKFFFSAPQAIPTSAINEAAYQIAHLIAATLTKQSLASGYAPS